MRNEKAKQSDSEHRLREERERNVKIKGDSEKRRRKRQKGARVIDGEGREEEKVGEWIDRRSRDHVAAARLRGRERGRRGRERV